MDLTTKELSAIEEQLIQEKLAVEKFKMFSETAQDPQLRSACQKIAAKHETHKNKLMDLLS